MAGWEIGSFINKMVTKKTGRSDWLFAKLTDSRDAKAKAKQAEQIKGKYAPKFKKTMSTAAFELMGGDDNFDISRFMKLRSSKAIISAQDQDGNLKWMTAEEAGKKSKGTIQKAQTEIQEEQGTVAKKITAAQQASPVASKVTEEAGIVAAKVADSKTVAKAATEAAPAVLKDATTRILEIERNAKQILAGIAGNTAQSAANANQASQASEGSSTDRKLNINDSDLLFIRSVLLG